MNEMSRTAGRASRLVTMAASIAAILLWASFYLVNRAELGTGTKVVMLVMMTLAGIALFAADKGAPGAALIVSLAALIPVGLYMLGGNNYSILIAWRTS